MVFYLWCVSVVSLSHCLLISAYANVPQVLTLIMLWKRLQHFFILLAVLFDTENIFEYLFCWLLRIIEIEVSVDLTDSAAFFLQQLSEMPKVLGRGLRILMLSLSLSECQTNRLIVYSPWNLVADPSYVLFLKYIQISSFKIKANLELFIGVHVKGRKKRW